MSEVKDWKRTRPRDVQRGPRSGPDGFLRRTIKAHLRPIPAPAGVWIAPQRSSLEGSAEGVDMADGLFDVARKSSNRIGTSCSPGPSARRDKRRRAGGCRSRAGLDGRSLGPFRLAPGNRSIVAEIAEAHRLPIGYQVHRQVFAIGCPRDVVAPGAQSGFQLAQSERGA